MVVTDGSRGVTQWSAWLVIKRLQNIGLTSDAVARLAVTLREIVHAFVEPSSLTVVVAQPDKTANRTVLC